MTESGLGGARMGSRAPFFVLFSALIGCASALPDAAEQELAPAERTAITKSVKASVGDTAAAESGGTPIAPRVCKPGDRQTCETSCGSEGRRTCDSAGQWTGECEPGPEICGNGIDDNCDGQIDEGCMECHPGNQATCMTTCGSTGTKTCDE